MDWVDVAFNSSQDKRTVEYENFGTENLVVLYTTDGSGQTTKNKYKWKYNLIFSFFDGDACVEQDSSRREFTPTKELSGVGTSSENWTSAKIIDLI